jgi:alkyldihydroxyacetonephosphate synthase
MAWSESLRPRPEPSTGAAGADGGTPGAPKDMRWWGWGDAAHPPALPAGALGYLDERLDLPGRPRPPVALEHVRLQEPALPDGALQALRGIVGSEHVRDDRLARVEHAAGKGYQDLIHVRAGRLEGAPDAVVYPASPRQLSELLAACAEHALAVVPFGGGTSVVGGLDPLRGAQEAVVALDMRRLAAVLEVDERSQTATVQAGLRVCELERVLARSGLTLGHFPQSYEHVSLGGCAATRSAGQASSGYGRFQEMVLGVGLCAPAGRVDCRALPASAAGPDLRQALVGSEGVLGAIDRLTLGLRPAPARRAYEGAFFKSFGAGVEALRELAQRRATPDVARLSDEQETAMSLALAGGGGAKGMLGRACLRARGFQDGCLAIFGFEDEAGRVRARRRRAHAVVRARGGLLVGSSPGRAWEAARFQAPYLRDDLLTHGVFVETLETAAVWSGLDGLYAGVRAAVCGALERCGTPGLVGCHVSHVYASGASLYFTLLAPQLQGREIEQWQAVKAAAAQAIAAAGGTITHHHAVGRHHAGWLEREIGAGGIAMLRALKSQLDPAGIMNPGKLLV